MPTHCGHVRWNLWWKLFAFSLMGKAKRWYNRTIKSRQGDWETLCSSFCLQFFPISRVVRLRLEVLSFRQKKKDSLGMAWEHFNTLIKTGPNLTIQDPILLQHFYMGLNRKTSRHLNTALGGSFLHVSANTKRSILTKILENTPKEVEKKPLQEKILDSWTRILTRPITNFSCPRSRTTKKGGNSNFGFYAWIRGWTFWWIWKHLELPYHEETLEV